MQYSILLTSQDIEIIGRALDEMPFKLVHQLVRNMQSQINAHNKKINEPETIDEPETTDAVKTET